VVSSTITDGVRQGDQGHEIPQGSCGANRARIRFAEDRNRRSCSKCSKLWFAKTSAETQNEAVLGGVGVNTIIVSIQQEDSGGGEPACAWSAHIYIYTFIYMYIIRTGRKSIRTMPLDCNDGAALRVAPVKGLDPKLRNEFCPKVSPSQVRDAYGPHDGNERTRRAIASDGFNLEPRQRARRIEGAI